MHSRALKWIVVSALLIPTAVVSAVAQPVGELRLEASASELLGDDAVDILGHALDPEEVFEWELYVPEKYDPGKPPGLLVFVSPVNSGKMPGAYQTLMEENNLIWIGANRSGNRVRLARRISLALLATALADRHYRINSSRVYISGFSGGGRTASLMAPAYPSMFRGAIYICGANFWNRNMPKDLEQVRSNRYVFLTGSKDLNRADTRRVHRAYKNADVGNVLLLDIEGMQHRMPKIEDLATAITFLDTGPSQ